MTITPSKIRTELNTADGKTKPIDTKWYWRHLSYTHNVNEATLKDEYGVTVPLADPGSLVCLLCAGDAAAP